MLTTSAAFPAYHFFAKHHHGICAALTSTHCLGGECSCCSRRWCAARPSASSSRSRTTTAFCRCVGRAAGCCTRASTPPLEHQHRHRLNGELMPLLLHVHALLLSVPGASCLSYRALALVVYQLKGIACPPDLLAVRVGHQLNGSLVRRSTTCCSSRWARRWSPA